MIDINKYDCEPLDIQRTLSSSAGSGTYDVVKPDKNEIWLIEAIYTSNRSSGGAGVNARILKRVGDEQYPIFVQTNVTASYPATFVGNLWLTTEDMLQLNWTGGVAADKLQISIQGKRYRRK